MDQPQQQNVPFIQNTLMPMLFGSPDDDPRRRLPPLGDQSYGQNDYTSSLPALGATAPQPAADLPPIAPARQALLDSLSQLPAATPDGAAPTAPAGAMPPGLGTVGTGTAATDTTPTDVSPPLPSISPIDQMAAIGQAASQNQKYAIPGATYQQPTISSDPLEQMRQLSLASQAGQKYNPTPVDRSAYLASLNQLPPAGDTSAGVNPDTGIPGIVSTGTTVAPTTTGAPAIGPVSDQQELAELEAKQKQYGPGVYQLSDGTKTSNPKKYADDKKNPNSTAKVITAPGTERKQNWSVWDKIGNALMGWAQGGLVGGIKGATDRNFFRKWQDEQKIRELLPRIQAQQAMAYKNAQIAEQTGKAGNEMAKPAQELAARQNAWNIAKLNADSRIEVQRQKDLNTANEWTQHIDPDTGEVSKLFTKGNRKMEPLYDENGKRVVDPRYSWYDPISKQTVKLGGKDFTTAQTPQIQGELSRQQTAETESVKAQNEANKEYVNRLDDWNKQNAAGNANLLKEAQNTALYGIQAKAEADKLASIQKDLDDLQAHVPNIEDDGVTSDTLRQHTALIEKKQKEYRDQAGVVDKAMRQSDVGNLFMQFHPITIPPKPEYRAPAKTTAISIGTPPGKTASADEVQRYATSKGMSPGSAAAHLKNLGYTITK